MRTLGANYKDYNTEFINYVSVVIFFVMIVRQKNLMKNKYRFKNLIRKDKDLNQ